jgi:hypothetical protein
MLRTIAGRRTGEDVEDLQSWLRGLEGCPPVTRTTLAVCPGESHGVDAATWFYVEADADAGVARRRCIACARVTPLLDSEDRWTYPPTWACPNCGDSIAEVAFGLHLEGSVDVTWIAIGVRCVECGTVAGVSDVAIAPTPVDAVLGAL